MSAATMTPLEAARFHRTMAFNLLEQLECQADGKYTADQIIAIAQIHATLAAAAAAQLAAEPRGVKS